MSDSSGHVLQPIFKWTEQIKHLTRDDVRKQTQAELTPLLPGPGEAIRSITDVGLEQYGDCFLFGFTAPGSRDVPPQRCYCYPLHFASLRVFDRITGLRLRMADETARLDKKRERIRPQSEKIFRLNLEIGQRRKLGVFGFKQGVTRVLFHAPHSAKLQERRTAHHRYLLPENHILTKWNPEKAPPGQDDVLDAVRKLTDADDAFGFSGPEIVALLTRLFTLNDEWYWDDLDRLPDDGRRSFNVLS